MDVATTDVVGMIRYSRRSLRAVIKTLTANRLGRWKEVELKVRLLGVKAPPFKSNSILSPASCLPT
jgi:hypothetical protein